MGRSPEVEHLERVVRAVRKAIIDVKEPEPEPELEVEQEEEPRVRQERLS